MIGVVGSLNMDLVARVPHIPAPGETVLGRAPLARHPGGKGGNQAVAAARLGAAVRFFGAVGRDAFGDELAAALAAEGIATSGLVRCDAASGCALINVGDGGENSISVLPGANALAPLPLPGFEQGLRALLLQLELPLATVAAWVEAGRAQALPVMLNAAPVASLPRAVLAALDTLVVNEGELQALAGGDLAAAAALGPRRVVVTLGARGAVAIDQGRRFEQPAPQVEVVDSTGAGDTFTGALAAALLQGRAFEEALARACMAGALACGRAGARDGMPRLAELEAALRHQESR